MRDWKSGGREEAGAEDEEPGPDEGPETGGIGGCCAAARRVAASILFRRELFRSTDGSEDLTEDKSKPSYLRR